MVISYNSDGTVTFSTDDGSASQTLSAGQTQAQIDAGATAFQAAHPIPVPDSVTMMQLRQALLNANRLTALETAIAAATKDTQVYWSFSGHVARNHPKVLAMIAAGVATSAQVDAAFRAASQIS